MSRTEHVRLRRLASKAVQSGCKSKHAAACFKGGNILSIGVNKNRAPGRKWIDGEPCSEHAEVAALRQIEDTTNVVLYVARARNNGSLGMSKPCHRCAEYIASRGIRRVIYSVDEQVMDNAA